MNDLAPVQFIDPKTRFGGNRYKAWGGRDNCGNYLLRAVIGVVEMPKIECHPHKVGDSARLHLLHDRGPVMLGRPCTDRHQQQAA
jgi:hypothetical protein